MPVAVLFFSVQHEVGWYLSDFFWIKESWKFIKIYCIQLTSSISIWWNASYLYIQIVISALFNREYMIRTETSECLPLEFQLLNKVKLLYGNIRNKRFASWHSVFNFSRIGLCDFNLTINIRLGRRISRVKHRFVQFGRIKHLAFISEINVYLDACTIWCRLTFVTILKSLLYIFFWFSFHMYEI